MTTIILAVIVAILVLDRLFNRPDTFDYDYVNGKVNDLRKQFNDLDKAIFQRFDLLADRAEEHVRAFQELADHLGYSVEIDCVLEGSLQELIEGKAKHSKVLIVKKKEDKKPAVRKRK